jgi:hypothetical protein
MPVGLGVYGGRARPQRQFRGEIWISIEAGTYLRFRSIAVAVQSSTLTVIIVIPFQGYVARPFVSGASGIACES